MLLNLVRASMGPNAALRHRQVCRETLPTVTTCGRKNWQSSPDPFSFYDLNQLPFFGRSGMFAASFLGSHDDIRLSRARG